VLRGAPAGTAAIVAIAATAVSHLGRQLLMGRHRGSDHRRRGAAEARLAAGAGPEAGTGADGAAALLRHGVLEDLVQSGDHDLVILQSRSGSSARQM
jgi:hypothetical protein